MFAINNLFYQSPEAGHYYIATRDIQPMELILMEKVNLSLDALKY